MAKSRRDQSEDLCTFCGRTASQVDRLIAGPPGVNICNDCVEVCSGLIRDPAIKGRPAARAGDAKPGRALPTPSEIKAHLDQYIIGQEPAKRTIAVAVYNHYKRLRHLQKSTAAREVELEKSNILMLGPTGSGKTAIARVLAKLLNVPFAIGDATTLTEAGYVGEDVENLILKLLQNADGDVARAEQGIIYVDEIDKIARSSGNTSITRDVSGEGVQQSLLKLVEGTVANVPPGGGRKHPEQKYIQVNTENILFICGGAFSGLTEIIARRIGEKQVGFKLGDKAGDAAVSDVEADDRLLAQALPEDLVEFGMIPEFIGRLPVNVALSPLTEEALVGILSQPKNALIKQYQALFAMEDAQLSFDEDALRLIARQAMARKTGARALRAIMEKLMTDIMFDLPERAKQHRLFRITREMVEAGIARTHAAAEAASPSIPLGDKQSA